MVISYCLMKTNIGKVFSKLQRITTSSLFIPEIDGLRFLAIAIVILFHMNVFVINKMPFAFSDVPSDHLLIYNFLANGFKGVNLFFVISGFILAMPFAKYYLRNEKKVILRNYFLRRLTRLEPPYIITMIACFFILLLTGRNKIADILPSLGTSLIYLHNILPYGPSVNNVAWSLEVEIQFYVLAPLLSALFILRKYLRRSIILLTIISLPIVHVFYKLPMITIYDYLQYFLIGFLLVDLYINEFKITLSRLASLIIGILLFFIIIYTNIGNATEEIIFMFSILVFYYLALNDPVWKKVFNIKWVTAIGGMCYTLYLWHYMVIAAIGNSTIMWRVSDQYLPTLLFQFVIIIPFVIFFSLFFYLFIERPCMDKSWPNKFYAFVKNKLVIHKAVTEVLIDKKD